MLCTGNYFTNMQDDTTQLANELIATMQELEALTEKANKTKSLLEARLMSANITSLQLANAEIKLAPKRGKKSSPMSEALAELIEAKNAEQQEMLEVNASQIYQLEQAVFEAQHKLELLQQSPFTKELEAKIAEEQSKLVGQQELTLQIVFAKPDYLSQLGDAELVAKIKAEARQFEPPMANSQLQQFAKAWLSGAYSQLCAKEAWQNRANEHISYWSAKCK